MLGQARYVFDPEGGIFKIKVIVILRALDFEPWTKKMKYIRYIFFILTLFLLTPAVTIILALLRIFNLAWTFGGHISKFWANVLLFSSGVKVQIFGMENIHPHNKYIFISNHLSHFDSVILQGKLPSKYRFLAKRELFRIPFFGWALSLAGHIKVDRGEGSLQKILDQAKNVLEKKALPSTSSPSRPEARMG
jgi:1-acyl-sn-glycerol-3-phosphate acyltransferase